MKSILFSHWLLIATVFIGSFACQRDAPPSCLLGQFLSDSHIYCPTGEPLVPYSKYLAYRLEFRKEKKGYITFSNCNMSTSTSSQYQMNFTYSTSGNKIVIEVGEIFYKYIFRGNQTGVGTLSEEALTDINKTFNYFPNTKRIELTYQCTDIGITFDESLLGSKNWKSYDFTTLY